MPQTKITGNSLLTKGLITREQLILANRQNFQYPLAIAEKDYFLALVSKIIYDSAAGNKLIFKGGTALHHIFLPQLRFSEDLDFSTNTVRISLEEVKSIFFGFDFLEVKKYYVSGATIKIELLSYTGPLNQPNSLKVEIDFLQNVVLPPCELDYQNSYGIKTKVRVMDLREIAAEKIRAMNDRARLRDFYDFVMIVKKFSVDLNEVFEIIRQKEIRESISPKNIFNHWQLVRRERQGKLSNIFYAEELSNHDVESVLKELNFKEIKKRD